MTTFTHDHRDKPGLHKLYVEWAMSVLDHTRDYLDMMGSFSQVSPSLLAGATREKMAELIRTDAAYHEAAARLFAGERPPLCDNPDEEDEAPADTEFHMQVASAEGPEGPLAHLVGKRVKIHLDPATGNVDFMGFVEDLAETKAEEALAAAEPRACRLPEDLPGSECVCLREGIPQEGCAQYRVKASDEDFVKSQENAPILEKTRKTVWDWAREIEKKKTDPFRDIFGREAAMGLDGTLYWVTLLNGRVISKEKMTHEESLNVSMAMLDQLFGTAIS